MLIFPQKINMDSHADFCPKNHYGWPCRLFLKKLTKMDMLIFPKKLTCMAKLIFNQKINMDGHADFFLKKSTCIAMLIISSKNLHGMPC